MCFLCKAAQIRRLIIDHAFKNRKHAIFFQLFLKSLFHHLQADLPRVATELEALKQLAHQNICRMYQFIETADKYYIIMEVLWPFFIGYNL
jgi:hypothetical protein